MNCYCYEAENDFLLCVEDVENALLEEAIQHAWFVKTDDDKFLKVFSMKDENNGVASEDKDNVKRNFAQLGQSMFHSMLDCNWEKALLEFARKCKENGIEWYIFGSVSDAVRGINVKPHDIDIVVHTRDFFKVKDLFFDFVVEPFIDKKDTFLVRYIGRLYFEGVMFDIVADKKMNSENHQYDQMAWHNYCLYAETMQNRYQLELKRNREDRIKAFEEYLSNHK